MPKSSSFLKQLLPLVYAIVAVPTFAVLLLVLFYEADRFGLLGGGPACMTEERARTSGLSGFDFEISETACFHDLGVSVFASRAGEGRRHFFSNTLLFMSGPIQPSRRSASTRSRYRYRASPPYSAGGTGGRA